MYDNKVSKSGQIQLPLALKNLSFWKDAFTKFRKNRLAMFGLVVLNILFIGAILGPFFTSHTYYDTHLALKNQPPSSMFWFGTDELGRDLFTRIWWGARISLFIGITAAIIDMAIGVFYGSFSALMGGKVDELLMRMADIFYSLPNLLIVILLMVIMGPGIITIIVAMALTGWINMARIVRSQILSLKQHEFVSAAVALGAKKSRILMRHLIPNAMGSILTTMTFTIPISIFTEAFLSFLGLGVQAPIASWGTMVNDGLSALRFYPWRLFFPAGFISITMLAFNLVGDGLRDSFDPRLKNGR
jgi:oligopeptide transport system permease protein